MHGAELFQSDWTGIDPGRCVTHPPPLLSPTISSAGMAIDARIRSNIWSRIRLTRSVLCFVCLPPGSSQYSSHGTAKCRKSRRARSAKTKSGKNQGEEEGTINGYISSLRCAGHFSTILERILLSTFGISAVFCTRKNVLGYFCTSL